MTDHERIERLEKMVKSLTSTLQRVISVVNTGNCEYTLCDIEAELREVREYSRESEDAHDHSNFLKLSSEPTPTQTRRAKFEEAATRCCGVWHQDKSTASWCDVCGRSI